MYACAEVPKVFSQQDHSIKSLSNMFLHDSVFKCHLTLIKLPWLLYRA